MADLKGTKTEKNLLTSFAGECQARNRYTFYATTAKKEGYEQISAIFDETADNEKQHAEKFFTTSMGAWSTSPPPTRPATHRHHRREPQGGRRRRERGVH